MKSFIMKKFNRLGETRIATDDGTYGMHGNVGNLLLGTKTEPTAVLHVVQTGY